MLPEANGRIKRITPEGRQRSLLATLRFGGEVAEGICIRCPDFCVLC